MKKLIRLLVFAALVATLALPALAQTTPATPAATPASGQDDAEAKTALYNKFTENRNTNPAVAYDAGKEYLAKYEAKDGPDDQYVKYIKKWVDSYDKIARRNQLLQQLKDKNYNEAFASSRKVLADFPDDLTLLYELSKAGLFAATGGNKANNADAVNYAKRTIQLIQSGKTFEKDKPIANKDEIIGGLNYSLGFFLRESQPTEAATYFINAAQVDGFAKKDPQTYIFLAEAYETSEYSKLATQFNASCKTEDQLKTPECVDLKAKADQSVDRLIDALARAIAYSNTSPDAAKYAQARTTWMETLTNYYKYRHEGSDAGLKELIAGITAKPLPKPGEPVAPSTPPATTTTPTQPGSRTNTVPSNTSTTPTTTAKPSNTTTPASTTTTQPNGKAATTQPTGKTSSTKTTPKRAHARTKRG
ncbi:MAG: hypothetical protein QOH25_2352 [Acidobacteriota bacterium]|jgi:hypothetical protein|nr:hypothetical protein [Acidobacteriota bacterium]